MSNQNDDCKHSHSETPPKLEEMEYLADFLKVFGDKTRIRILYLLSQDEFCVTHIADALGMTTPAISQQLRVLKSNRLIKSRREGKEMIYSLDDHHILQILTLGMSHVHEVYPPNAP